MCFFIKKHWIHFIFRRVQSIRHISSMPSRVYTGLTNNQIIRFNDVYQGHHIFFNSMTCLQTNVLMSNTQLTIPKRNDFICGIVCKYNNRYYYKSWFTCTYEFLYLWTLIFNKNHPCLFNGCHRKSNTDIILQLPHYHMIAQHFLPPSRKLRPTKHHYRVHRKRKSW